MSNMSNINMQRSSSNRSLGGGGGGRERSDSIRSTGERARFRKQRSGIFGFFSRLLGMEDPASTLTRQKSSDSTRKPYAEAVTRKRSLSGV
jgi:hypothetical protein